MSLSTHALAYSSNTHSAAQLFKRDEPLQTDYANVQIDPSTGEFIIYGKRYEVPLCINDVSLKCTYSAGWVETCGDITEDCPEKCDDIASGKFKIETDKCIKEYCKGDQLDKTIKLFDAIQEASKKASDEVCRKASAGGDKKGDKEDKPSSSGRVGVKGVFVLGMALVGLMASF